MIGFTTTTTIGLKKGETGNTPFIRLVSHTFNSSEGRIDCVIEIAKSKTVFNANEKKQQDFVDKQAEIASQKSIAIAEKAKAKPNKGIITAALASMKTKKVELSSLPPYQNLYTRQYPSYVSGSDKTEDEVYALIKADYTGAVDVA